MQQQQQPGSMFPVMPSFPPTNITTEQIQKYLDENKKLILAILDNQNLGKLAECAQYQALLQKNLMYLAAIADAQPQTPAVPPQHTQMAPHPSMKQGGFYMQQQQQLAQQPGLFAPRPTFNSSHTVMQNPLLPQAQSQLPQMQMPIGLSTSDNANLGGIPHIRGSGNNYINNNSKKQEKPDGGRNSDGQGSSAVGDKEEETK